MPRATLSGTGSDAPPPVYPDATLVALFSTGLLGGVHCAGMCGGIVGALGLLGGTPRTSALSRTSTPAGDVPAAAATVPLRFVARVPADRAPPSTGFATTLATTPVAYRPSRGSASLLAYNLGRLSSYTALGAAAGTVGSFGWLLGEALPLQQIAYAASSALLILMGAYVIGERRVSGRLEALGSAPWRRVRPLATAALARAGSLHGAVAAGALWGLVPCGMVYAALAAALLAGDGARGAALMLAFGLGTLPNLLLLGAGAGRLRRWTRHRPVRLAAGATIASFGVLGFLRLDVATELPLLRELCVRLPGVGA